jgi:hypothetical protein
VIGLRGGATRIAQAIPSPKKVGRFAGRNSTLFNARLPGTPIVISRECHVLHLRRVQHSPQPSTKLGEDGSEPRKDRMLRVIKSCADGPVPRRTAQPLEQPAPWASRARLPPRYRYCLTPRRRHRPQRSRRGQIWTVAWPYVPVRLIITNATRFPQTEISV